MRAIAFLIASLGSSTALAHGPGAGYALALVGIPLLALAVTVVTMVYAHRKFEQRKRWTVYAWVIALIWIPVPIAQAIWPSGAVWIVALEQPLDEWLFAFFLMGFVGAAATLLIRWTTPEGSVSPGIEQ